MIIYLNLNSTFKNSQYFDNESFDLLLRRILIEIFKFKIKTKTKFNSKA